MKVYKKWWFWLSIMSEIKPLTLVSGCNLGVLISEHKKIVSDNFLCRKFLFGIFMHPKNLTNHTF